LRDVSKSSKIPQIAQAISIFTFFTGRQSFAPLLQNVCDNAHGQIVLKNAICVLQRLDQLLGCVAVTPIPGNLLPQAGNCLFDFCDWLCWIIAALLFILLRWLLPVICISGIGIDRIGLGNIGGIGTFHIAIIFRPILEVPGERWAQIGGAFPQLPSECHYNLCSTPFSVLLRFGCFVMWPTMVAGNFGLKTVSTMRCDRCDAGKFSILWKRDFIVGCSHSNSGWVWWNGQSIQCRLMETATTDWKSLVSLLFHHILEEINFLLLLLGWNMAEI
jgi:hypothetical protein